LYIYAIDHDEYIERSPVTFKFDFNGVTRHYTVDFKYKDQLVEVKGDHFFNEEGVLINFFDPTKNDLALAKYNCSLENGVVYFKGKEITKFLDYVNEKYTKDFLKLFRVDLEFPYPNRNLRDITFDGLIRHFHKSIYEANVNKYKSPLEAWSDKDLIYKCALNRLKYANSCKPEDILRGFSVAKIAPKVSVFSSKLAKNLISKYLFDATLIFDPFSGFSGRMLGAISNDIPYIGCDINEKHILESKEILNHLGNNNCNMYVKDIFESSGTYDCLFTCPPYSNKEQWNPTDIDLSCDE